MRQIPVISFILFMQQVSAFDVIAHRGYSCPEAENSVLSVQQAWRAGADAVELDVRVSTDGVVYLFHDDEIQKTKVEDLSFSEVAVLTGKTTYRLADTLKILDADGYFVLDLKTRDPGDIDKILNIVETSSVPQKLISFQSESIESLEHIRSVMPEVHLTFLSHLKWKIPYVLHPGAEQLVRGLDGHDIDRVSIKGRSFIDREYVDVIQSSGHEVHVWTINDPKRAKHYESLGVDGVITDQVEGIVGGAMLPKACTTSTFDAG